MSVHGSTMLPCFLWFTMTALVQDAGFQPEVVQVRRVGFHKPAMRGSSRAFKVALLTLTSSSYKLKTELRLRHRGEIQFSLQPPDRLWPASQRSGSPAAKALNCLQDPRNTLRSTGPLIPARVPAS